MCDFSQTELCEGGFAFLWTRLAEADRPLWPRRAALAEGGILTPAGQRRAHRWAGGRGRACSAHAPAWAGALPGRCSSSRLGPCAEGSGEEPRDTVAGSGHTGATGPPGLRSVGGVRAMSPEEGTRPRDAGSRVSRQSDSALQLGGAPGIACGGGRGWPTRAASGQWQPPAAEPRLTAPPDGPALRSARPAAAAGEVPHAAPAPEPGLPRAGRAPRRRPAPGRHHRAGRQQLGREDPAGAAALPGRAVPAAARRPGGR